MEKKYHGQRISLKTLTNNAYNMALESGVAFKETDPREIHLRDAMKEAHGHFMAAWVALQNAKNFYVVD